MVPDLIGYGGDHGRLPQIDGNAAATFQRGAIEL